MEDRWIEQTRRVRSQGVPVPTENESLRARIEEDPAGRDRMAERQDDRPGEKHSGEQIRWKDEMRGPDSHTTPSERRGSRLSVSRRLETTTFVFEQVGSESHL